MGGDYAGVGGMSEYKFIRMYLPCLSFKQHRALLSAGLRRMHPYKFIFTGHFVGIMGGDKLIFGWFI